MKKILALGVAATLCTAAPAVAGNAEGYDEQAMMEAWMKAATPGEQHTMLASMAGEWKTTTTMYEMGQAAEPTEGSASFEVLMGGRVVKGVHSGMMMGMPFDGISMEGFDNVTGKYWSTWVDTMGTGLYVMHGKDMGDHLSYKGMMTMPVGGEAKMRMDMMHEGDDKAVMKMYMTYPGSDEEQLSMVMEYARVN